MGSEIAKQIEDTKFPGNDQQAGWVLMEAYKLYPKDVGKALLHRLESGHEIPFRSEELLRATESTVDDGPLTKLVLRPETTQRIAVDACSVVGPKTVGRLIDEFIGIDAEIKAAGAQITEPTREALPSHDGPNISHERDGILHGSFGAVRYSINPRKLDYLQS